MRVLITGGAGFLGTWVTRRLLRAGAEVTVLDRFSPSVHGANDDVAVDVRRHVHLVRGDVCDRSLLRRTLCGHEAVIHLAAETDPAESMFAIAHYEQANIAGTTTLFDLLTEDPSYAVERLVVASSHAIYGEGAWRCRRDGVVYPAPRNPDAMPDRGLDPACPACGGDCSPVSTPETAPLNPASIYAMTKQVQDQMARMLAARLGLTAFALRYYNIYGPRQSPVAAYTGLLSRFCDQAHRGEPIELSEDGRQTRDFIHVIDAAEATVRCLTANTRGAHAVNVGSGMPVTLLEVAERITEWYGSASEIRVSGDVREGEPRHGRSNPIRARELLGFVPQWSFDRGLEQFLVLEDHRVDEPCPGGRGSLAAAAS